MFAAYPGDIVFSKIDARHGAIGILSSSIPKAVVTSEFPVFTGLPDKVDASYLALILQSPHFIGMLASRASGTSGRKRITPAHFQELQIPLPSLKEQQALVAKWHAVLDESARLEGEAELTEYEGAQSFAMALGLTAPPPLPDKPAFIARFSVLDRWSHEATLRRTTGTDPPPPKYPLVALGDVIADLENGWSPKCLDRPARPNEWGVLKLGAVSFGTFNEQENKALPATLTARPTLEVKQGEVLVSRANITRLVGATAYVDSVRPRLMLCDKIFRLIFRDASQIDPAFAAEVLRTQPVRGQIEANVTGTSPTMKNISKPALLALAFPLPPLDVQRALVHELTVARVRAAGLREEARAALVAARADFEAAIWT